MIKLLTSAVLISSILFLSAIHNSFGQTVTLLQPSNMATCQNLQTTFDWQASNAQKYDLQVAYTAGFTNLIVDEKGLTASEFTATLPAYDTSYYWRVSCTFTDNSTAMSNTWVFYTKQSAPTPTQPANNATCLDTALQFSWSYVAASNRYWLQISTAQDFSSITYTNNNITTTSIALPNLAFNTNYYWRVKSFAGSCESDWSPVFRFSTREGPPILLSPDNGALLVPFNLVLRWSSSPAPVSYNIQVGTTPYFDTLIVNQTGWTADTFQLNLSEYNKTYYWRVRGVYSVCQSNWSRARMFKTPYQPPLLLEPEDTSDCVHLRSTFIWGVINGALSYRLQIAKDSLFSTIVRNLDKITGNFVNVALDSPLTKYYWHVRAEDTTNFGLWSNTQSFSTTIKEPVLLAPSNQSTGNSLAINFSWKEGSSQELHRLQISRQQNFLDLVLDTADLTNPNFTFILPDYNTEYYWRVSSQYLNCTSAWTSEWKFKTKIAAPHLIYPVNGSTRQPLSILFQWDKVADADYYEINVASDTSFTKIVQGNKGIAVNQVLLKNFLPTTDYYWRVQASNEEGKSDWSTTFKFTTGIRGPEIPKLVSPRSGSTLIPVDPQLIWMKSNRADKYIVQVSEDEFFGTFEFNKDDITDTSAIITGLEYYKRYFWRVAAINDSGQSKWSDQWNFRTTAQAPADAPILIAPSNNMDNTEVHLKFSWNAVPRAEGYHLQVSEDENFTESILFFNSDKVWATEANIYDMKYGTKYYWRVAAFNEAGKTEWSDVWSFTTKSSSGFQDMQSNISGFKIIPNPADNNAILNLVITEAIRPEINIINSVGDVVLKVGTFNLIPGNTTIPITTESLAEGMYFLIIRTVMNQYALPIVILK